MKTIWTLLISIMMSIGLSGCTCNDKKPPHRAFYNKTSNYGMQYHITLYEAFQDGGAHSIQCGDWHYIPTHIYTDRLGVIEGDEIIWKNLDGQEFPFEENGMSASEVHLNITKKSIEVQGFTYKSGNDTMNGTYRVEVSSPDSWGVPIVKGIPLLEE